MFIVYSGSKEKGGFEKKTVLTRCATVTQYTMDTLSAHESHSMQEMNIKSKDYPVM